MNELGAPVLVLNANYEPLNVCDVRRALGMILTEKARLVINGRGTIRTVNALFDLPSVIRLENQITHPRPRVKLTRREVFRRDHATCQYCGRHAATLTIDHVIPRHMGGEHIWNNVVTACSACNHHKGGRLLSEARMKLLHQPKEPPASAGYIFGRHLEANTEWEPFITGW
jgi:5-methylcytosine-specific restriction endonuclease McrA